IKVLRANAITAEGCTSVAVLCAEIEKGVGVVLISLEMAIGNPLLLKNVLTKQEPWSEIPFIVVLPEGGTSSVEITSRLNPLEYLTNITAMESPVRIVTLVSTVRSALFARARQFQVRDLITRLDETRRQAVAANRSKSDFLANMSHEIRTPLNAIIGFSEFLIDPMTDEEEKVRFAETIKRNGQLLAQIIDDILDLSKIEAGKVELERIPCSLSLLVSDIHALFTLESQKKGVSLTIESEPHIPDQILSDPTRLKQIIVNLVGNALKFTQQGSVGLRLFTNESDNGRKFLQISVTDTGRGISQEQRVRLFQPFMQADESTTRHYGGTGLGLILSRHLARALGGELILLRSEIDQGSTFQVTVPLDVTATPSAQTAREKSECNSLGEKVFTGLTVLVTDDTTDSRMLLGRVLMREGAGVDFAIDGKEAIEKIEANSYDMVLMDIQMPVMDGVEAIRELRRRGYTKPVVALTAHALHDEKKKAMAAGFTAYLTKPINRPELISTVLQFTAHSVASAPL
ncbi:MAG: response regulator, partial [Proteobacteria bacterium]